MTISNSSLLKGEVPVTPPSIRDLLQQSIEAQAKTQQMVHGLTQLTAATTKATFATFDSRQRGEFCRALQEQGYGAQSQADLIGKSEPSVYRYINSK